MRIIITWETKLKSKWVVQYLGPILSRTAYYIKHILYTYNYGFIIYFLEFPNYVYLEPRTYTRLYHACMYYIMYMYIIYMCVCVKEGNIYIIYNWRTLRRRVQIRRERGKGYTWPATLIDGLWRRTGRKNISREPCHVNIHHDDVYKTAGRDHGTVAADARVRGRPRRCDNITTTRPERPFDHQSPRGRVRVLGRIGAPRRIARLFQPFFRRDWAHRKWKPARLRRATPGIMYTTRCRIFGNELI